MPLKIVPLILALHTSNPTAGPQSEVTQDYVGAGLELSAPYGFTLTATLGYKDTNCKAFEHCTSSAAGSVELKWAIGQGWIIGG